MLVIGLTGGMGMGKTTVARMFCREGIPVFDADSYVRLLQSPGGKAIPLLKSTFPDVIEKGVLNRALLREKVKGSPTALKQLEAIIHPLVKEGRQHFIAQCYRRCCFACVLDVPLLFEADVQKECSFVVTVSASSSLQMQRIMKRKLMTEAQVRSLIARQLPDREKRRRADFIIYTGLSLWHTLKQVKRLLYRIKAKKGYSHYGTRHFV